MPNVCLIPCFNRPEFLWHCIRNIEKADGVDDIHFLFRPDRGHDPEILDVIAGFKLKYDILAVPEKARIAGIMKQSWSVLMGYGIAQQMAGDGLVYYVEEDVMVGNGFFTWGAWALKNDGSFCAIASEDTNTPLAGRPERNCGPNAYSSQGTYRSIGVCWTAENLRKFVQPHCVTPYFLNPWNYIKQHFPTDPLGSGFCEQDGLIRRIQLTSGLPIAYPFEPLCYHAGYYGYNRGNPNKPKGSLAQRIEEVGKVIYSNEEMKRVNQKKPGFYEDSKPIPLCPTSDTTLLQ